MKELTHIKDREFRDLEGKSYLVVERDFPKGITIPDITLIKEIPKSPKKIKLHMRAIAKKLLEKDYRKVNNQGVYVSEYQITQEGLSRIGKIGIKDLQEMGYLEKQLKENPSYFSIVESIFFHFQESPIQEYARNPKLNTTLEGKIRFFKDKK